MSPSWSRFLSPGEGVDDKLTNAPSLGMVESRSEEAMDQRQDPTVSMEDKHSIRFPETDGKYAEKSGNRNQVLAIMIAAYLLLFVASFFVQGRLSSTSNLVGVVAQFQVMISVVLVMAIPRVGYFVALAVNAAELLLLTGYFLVLGDSRVLPGLFVCLCTMLTLTIISLFGRRLQRKNWELSRSEAQLSRLYQEVSAVGQRSDFLANHDELTGLANARNLRARVADHYGAASPSLPKGGLALIKLENFKVINSIFGARAGDAVLKEVARRLQEFADQNSLHAARLESSTFALFSPALCAMEEPLQRILLRVHEQLHLDEGSLEVRACAGYAECGGDADDVEALYQCAEFAISLSRQAGSQAVRIYDSHMAKEARRCLAIINALEMALKHEEFTLLYQPQIDVVTGRITGAEALIRWQNPGLGYIMPSEFVPLAEQNGQILAISNWILERACRDASRWPEAWKVSVNISSGQFFDRNFESQIAHALAASGLSPSRLKLEITESVLIGDETNVAGVLARLRFQQVTIALDDFGTGYSSLSYLKNIPLDELKIDRSFVATMEDDPNSKAIVGIIIHLAQLLNLTTTAEGIETVSQAQILKSLGCDCFQGYLYGKPMAVEAFLSLEDSCVC